MLLLLLLLLLLFGACNLPCTVPSVPVANLHICTRQQRECASPFLKMGDAAEVQEEGCSANIGMCIAISLVQRIGICIAISERTF